MAEEPTQPNLEERSFLLGVEAAPLPEEPEPLNRKFYNLGLEVYHIQWRLRSIRDDIDEIINDAHEKKIKQNAKQDYKDALVDYLTEAKKHERRFQKIREEYPSLEKYLIGFSETIQLYTRDISGWKTALEMSSRD